MSNQPRSKLEQAIQFALIAHQGQTDYNGQPYILHPLAVMFGVSEVTESEDVLCAAVLHDTYEDDPAVTLEEIEEKFGPEVRRLVYALSRYPGGEMYGTPDHIYETPEEPYDDFITRVIKAGDDAMLIKLCDIRHNSDQFRMAAVEARDPAKAARLRAKYDKARKRLNDVLWGDHF